MTQCSSSNSGVDWTRINILGKRSFLLWTAAKKCPAIRKVVKLLSVVSVGSSDGVNLSLKTLWAPLQLFQEVPCECMRAFVRVPSLSLSSGIFLSVSRTAWATWSYMCSGGLEPSGRLPWCSWSQCSSSRPSLSRDAAGGEGAESSGGQGGNNAGNPTTIHSNEEKKNQRHGWPVDLASTGGPRSSSHWRWKTITNICNSWVWTNRR